LSRLQIQLPTILLIQAGKLHIDLEKDNFQELLEYDTQELTNMDLMALKLYRMENNVTEEKKSEQTTRFNTNRRAGGFNVIYKALSFFGSQNPNIQRFATVVAVVHKAIVYYMLISKRDKHRNSEDILA
jgi:phage pi2 protein 07